MLGLLSLAAASLISTAGVAPVSQISYPETPIVEFVTDNFSTFVSEYNRYHEDSLVASRVVRTRSLVLDDDQTGYYFDFDKGFMVATDDYDILFISNYDPTYENELFLTDGDIYFSGTAFFDQDGTEFGLDDSDFMAGQDLNIDALSSTVEPTNDPDGKIKNDEISNYISENYPGYEIVDERYIWAYDYIAQMDTSVFVRHEGGTIYSEGNCVLNSTYSMLHNMGKKHRDKYFYSKDYYVDYSGEAVANDAHYSRMMARGYVPNDYWVRGTPNHGEDVIENLPSLYLRLRDRAISSYGYDEIDGMMFADVKNMIADIEGWYGYDTKFEQTNNFNTVKELIDDDIPVFVGVNGSTTYGDHAMSVNGYIKLQKESGWWIFKSTSTKWLLAVDDGHQVSCVSGTSENRRFYDPNKKGGATFICADEDSIDFSGC